MFKSAIYLSSIWLLETYPWHQYSIFFGGLLQLCNYTDLYCFFLDFFKIYFDEISCFVAFKTNLFSNLKKANCKVWYNGVWICLSRMELWCVNYETMAYSSNEMQRNNYFQIKIELFKIKLNFVNICIKLLSLHSKLHRCGLQ